MLWLIYTTGECNLKCSYCGGSFDPNVVPWGIKYDLKALKEKIESDPEAVIIFYGGEPLLNPNFIMNVMDNIKAKRFGIQTNGTNIQNLPQSYWKNMNVVLLSIDGKKQTTDRFRGRGTYDKVLKSFKVLNSIGIEKIIARMTVTQYTDIYEDVMHLFSVGFKYVHWQLNAVWSKRWNIKSWAESSYIPGIKKLKKKFLNYASKGKVLGIVPFLGILSAHYFEGYKGPPCGAGYRSVSITTDGRVLSCPIAVFEKWAELGSVNKGFVLKEIEIPTMCKTCKYFRYCGGRCLYSLMEGRNLWQSLYYDLDEITRKTIEEVIDMTKYLDRYIKSGILNKNLFKYDPTLDSTEVIP